ncbi:hypothetical protein GCM10010468_05730 [Actinocorallia longicatena]|uniref:Uncharacterized protein n=1 Tax=Actinocorallia longicatena TaxID=111803 RepID=A0ABP6PXQ6_9ACTN
MLVVEAPSRHGTTSETTPTDWSPSFSTTIGASTRADGPSSLSTRRASAFISGRQSQVDLATKWCRLCSTAEPPVSAAMFRIDRRPSTSRSPWT